MVEIRNCVKKCMQSNEIKASDNTHSKNHSVHRQPYTLQDETETLNAFTLEKQNGLQVTCYE